MENDCWHKAIETKNSCLRRNQTWDIVSYPLSIKPLGKKFVFSIKLHLDGFIDRYMTHLFMLENKQ